MTDLINHGIGPYGSRERDRLEPCSVPCSDAAGTCTSDCPWLRLDEPCSECGCPSDQYDGHACEDYATRPATRVGRELIFEGGECRRMGLVEYALVKFGIKRTVARATRRESR